jgi:hypothetical protein
MGLTGDASIPRYRKKKLCDKWMETLALTLLLIQQTCCAYTFGEISSEVPCVIVLEWLTWTIE